MKTYKIFLKKTKQGIFEDVIMVKEGFILWAFLFNVVWLFYKKVFKQALLMTSLFFILSILNNTITFLIIFSIQLAITFYIGFEASDWYAESLKKRGYEFLGYASGRNAKEARLRFLDEINRKGQKSLKIKTF